MLPKTMLTFFRKRNLRRAETVLYRLNIRSRAEIKQKFDDLSGVSGLGKKLERDVEWALRHYSKEEWDSVFRWIKDTSQE